MLNGLVVTLRLWAFWGSSLSRWWCWLRSSKVGTGKHDEADIEERGRCDIRFMPACLETRAFRRITERAPVLLLSDAARLIGMCGQLYRKMIGRSLCTLYGNDRLELAGSAATLTGKGRVL